VAHCFFDILNSRGDNAKVSVIRSNFSDEQIKNLEGVLSTIFEKQASIH